MAGKSNPPVAGRNARQTAARLVALEEVARLRLMGASQAECVQLMKVTKSTMSRYWRTLDQMYRERATDMAEVAAGRALERLDRMHTALWADAYRRPPVGPDGRPAPEAAEVKEQRNSAIDRVLKIQREERAILGYGSPEVYEHRGSDDHPIGIRTVEAILPSTVEITQAGHSHDTNGTNGYHALTTGPDAEDDDDE